MGTSASPMVAAHSPSLISPFGRLYHGSPHHPIHALQSPRLRPGPGLRTRMTEPQPPSQPPSQPQPPPQPQATATAPLTSLTSLTLAPPHHAEAAPRAKLSTTALFASHPSHPPPRPRPHSSSQSSNDSARPSIEVASIPEDPSALPDPPDNSDDDPPPPPPKAAPVPEPKIELEPAPVQQAALPAPRRDLGNASSPSANAAASSSPSNKRRNSTRGDSAEPQASPATTLTRKKKQRPEVRPPKPVPTRYWMCPVDDLVVLIAHMIEELIQTNDALALSSGSLTRFHSRTAPGISVLEYLRRLARHATLTQPILLSMVYYIDRLCAMYPEFTINTLTVHRFLITAGTVAAKGLLDSYWTNATYARVGGVRLAELKLLELEFLYRVDWRIIPNPEVLVAYYQGLVDRHPEYAMEGGEEEGGGEEEEEEEDMFDDSDDAGIEVRGREGGRAEKNSQGEEKNDQGEGKNNPGEGVI